MNWIALSSLGKALPKVSTSTTGSPFIEPAINPIRPFAPPI